MENYSEHPTVENDNGINDSCPETRTLSLLTLADLAVALQDQGDDHNYARIHDIPQVLDEQCLLVKEKDHNYSTRSKIGLRGRAKCTDNANGNGSNGTKYVIMKKSSSEENLTSLSTSNYTSDIFSPISKKSNSCEQVVTTCVSRLNSSHSYHSQSTNSNCQSSLNKPCGSWPNETVFNEIETPVSQTTNIPDLQLVCDHTYARDQELFVHNEHFVDTHAESNPKRDSLFQTEHNYDIRGKFSFNNPRKIDISKKSKTIMKGDNLFYKPRAKEQQVFREQAIPQISKTDLLSSDHNYTYRTIHSFQTSGSIESLDMDLSESETDSCDETEHDKAKLYIQEKNTQLQDHPYSKSEILSF